MSELERLLNKHRANGLLIDTNLFLLLLVGATNPNRITQFDRTAQFTIPDFKLLQAFAKQFQRIITTPHILTEISNLAKIKSPELGALRERFRAFVKETEEFFEKSQIVMEEGTFLRLGLTDAAVMKAVRHDPVLVLTDDLDLYRTLLAQGSDAINFNHIRSF